MAERAHPKAPGFQEGSPYRVSLFKRYAFANKFTEGKTILDIPSIQIWRKPRRGSRSYRYEPSPPFPLYDRQG